MKFRQAITIFLTTFIIAFIYVIISLLSIKPETNYKRIVVNNEIQIENKTILDYAIINRGTYVLYTADSLALELNCSREIQTQEFLYYIITNRTPIRFEQITDKVIINKKKFDNYINVKVKGKNYTFKIN